MKVAELIERLQTFDSDAEVKLVQYDNEFGGVAFVYDIKDEYVTFHPEFSEGHYIPVEKQVVILGPSRTTYNEYGYPDTLYPEVSK